MGFLIQMKGDKMMDLKTLDDIIEREREYSTLTKCKYWIRHKFLSIRDFFPNLFWDIKYFIQRGRRGWSDKDVWSLDSHFTNVITQSLLRLIEIHHGCPQEFFSEKKKGKECEKWVVMLKQIIEGFEANQKLMDLDFAVKSKEEKKLKDKWKKGSELFIKYYNSLWD